MKQGKISVNFVMQRNALLGCNIYQARPDIYTQIEHAAVVTYAAKAAGIHESDMLATLEALVDAFSYYVCNGHSFKLDGVGTFSLSLSAATADPTNPVAATGAAAVQSLGINFLPDKSLKELLSSTSLETKASNPNKLVEMETPFITSISSENYSVSLFGMGLTKGFFLEKGTITVKGYNLSKTTKVVVKGDTDKVANLVPTMINKSQTVALCGYSGEPIEQVNKVELYEGATMIAEYNISGAATAGLSVQIGSSVIASGAVIAAGSYTITVRGTEVRTIAVKLDDVPLQAYSATASKVTFTNVSLTQGTHKLTVGEVDYTLNITAQAQPNVTRLTANGITVPNGGSSSMRSGDSYTMIASGNNLNLLSASDITTTGRLNISNVTISSTQVQFTCAVDADFTGAASIKIGNFFTVNVTVSNAEQTITALDGIRNNGSVTVNVSASLAIEGNYDLSRVTPYVARQSNPSAASVSAGVWIDQEKKWLKIDATKDSGLQSPSIIYLRDGDTTLFTLNTTYTNQEDVYE